MNEQEKSEKLIAIMNDEAIMTEIANAETKEDMQAVFAANGLDMTIAEVEAFINLMNTDDESEISENDLDSVSGGSVSALWVFSTAAKGVKKIAKSCWKLGKWMADRF